MHRCECLTPNTSRFLVSPGRAAWSRLLDRCVQALNLLAIVFENGHMPRLMANVQKDVAQAFARMDFREFVVTRNGLIVTHQMVQVLMEELTDKQCVSLPPSPLALHCVMRRGHACPLLCLLPLHCQPPCGRDRQQGRQACEPAAQPRRGLLL